MEIVRIKKFIWTENELRLSFEKELDHKIPGYFRIGIMWKMPQLDERDRFIRITECTTNDYNKDFCKDHRYSFSQMFEHLKKYYKLSLPQNIKGFDFLPSGELTLAIYY